MRTVTVSLVPGTKYQQRITNGNHSVIADVDVQTGGDGAGLDPKELALGALGACTAMTVMMVAPRRKWDLKRITVTVTQTEEANPADTTKTQMVLSELLEVEGNLTPKELDDIKAVAARCPVYKLMTEPKRTETTVKLVPPPKKCRCKKTTKNKAKTGKQAPADSDSTTKQ